VDHPGTPAVIMGDLNENYDEYYRRNGKIISALFPDDPEAAEYLMARSNAVSEPMGMQNDFLILSAEKPPFTGNFDNRAVALYSPWGQELQNGSYYYHNEWETIDHFLLSENFFDRSGWDFDSCRVADREPFVNDQGIPAAYNPRTGQGLSDHLPLILVLTKH
jgi:endonuclease/exonuclease/phosphatase family metal-dependent hydrolase